MAVRRRPEQRPRQDRRQSRCCWSMRRAPSESRAAHGRTAPWPQRSAASVRAARGSSASPKTAMPAQRQPPQQWLATTPSPLIKLLRSLFLALMRSLQCLSTTGLTGTRLLADQRTGRLKDDCVGANRFLPTGLDGASAVKTASIRISGVDVVPLVGIELTTYRLQGGCSTN